MEAIQNWVKGIVITFFVFSMLLYLVPKEEYKKYIVFIMNLLVAYTLVMPVLRATGGLTKWNDRIRTEEFRLELDQLMEDNDYFEECYKKELNESMKEYLSEYGEVEDTEISVTDAGELDFVYVRLKLIRGNSEEAVRSFLEKTFELEPEQIEVQTAGTFAADEIQ